MKDKDLEVLNLLTEMKNTLVESSRKSENAKKTKTDQ